MQQTKSKFANRNRVDVVRIDVQPANSNAGAIHEQAPAEEMCEKPSLLKRFLSCFRRDLGNQSDPEPEEDFFDAPERNHFAYHCHVMNKMNITRSQRARKRKSIKKENKLSFGYVSFIMIGIIACLHGVGHTKYQVFVDTEKPIYCILLGYYLNRAFSRFTFFGMLTVYKERLELALTSVRDAMEEFHGCFDSRKVQLVCILLALSSGIRIVLQNAQYQIPAREWSVQTVINYRSYQLADTLFYWQKVEKNGTDLTYDYLAERYGEKVNGVTISLAGVHLGMETSGTVYDTSIKDTIFVAALTLYIICKEFKRELAACNGKGSTKLSRSVWRKYCIIKDVSWRLSALLGMLLNTFHLDSLSTGAHLFFEFTDGDYTNGLVFYLLYDMIKAGLIYYMLADVSATNGDFRRFIQENYRHAAFIEVEGEDMVICVATFLDELSTNPIGIRSNAFVVNTEFTIQLIGVIGQYFMLLLSATEDQEGTKSR